MDKVVIEFTEKDEAIDALKASDYKVALLEIYNELRRYHKYSDDEHEVRIGGELMNKFNSTCNALNIDLWS
jgi:hypothetical protein